MVEVIDIDLEAEMLLLQGEVIVVGIAGFLLLLEEGEELDRV